MRCRRRVEGRRRDARAGSRRGIKYYVPLILVIFVLAVLIPFIGMGLFYLEHPDMQRLTPFGQFALQELASYVRPKNLIDLSAKTLMLLLIFSPNAQPWFSRSNS